MSHIDLESRESQIKFFELNKQFKKLEKNKNFLTNRRQFDIINELSLITKTATI